MPGHLSPHLRRLEAEAIHIMREVVAEFRNPVMLYSIGKDSSVMLHLALKAFYPAKPPFPLLHVDTTWKFREMIAFRDEAAKRAGMDLIVHINQDGVRARHLAGRLGVVRPHPGDEDRGAAPGARQVRVRRGLRRRPARRGEEPRQGAHLLAPLRKPTPGTRATSGPELWHLFNTRIKPGRVDAGLPAVELDRARRLGLHPGRGDPGRAALFRQGAAGGATATARSSWSTTSACRWSPARRPRMELVRFRTLGCYPLTGAVDSDAATLDDDHRRDARLAPPPSARAG